MIRKIFFVVLTLLIMEIGTARATLVRLVNIRELAGLAHMIVKGTVTDIQTAEENGRFVNHITITVLDWIKKPANAQDDTVVFTQLADGSFTTKSGKKFWQRPFFPKYEVGQTYVFFLPKPHRRTGLSAPIALEQGVFRVETDESGGETIPELKSRARFLKKDLGGSLRSQFLKFQLDSLGDEASYSTFKTMIESALKE